jgi:hypothetical protein
MKTMKTRTGIGFVCALAAAAVLTSCSGEAPLSSSVPADQILRDYHVMCTNDADTYVTATFFAEAGFDTMNNPFGRRLQLDPPAKVTFNDAPMEMKETFLTGIEYKAVRKDWPGEFKWVWTDNEGVEHENSAKMSPIGIPNKWLLLLESITSVTWDGPPVQEGEVVEVTIYEGENNENSWTFQTTEAGAESISIEAAPIIDVLNMSRYSIEVSRSLAVRLYDGEDDWMKEGPETGCTIRLKYIVEKY